MISDRNDTQAKPVLDTTPEGRLAIVPLKSTMEIGRKIDEYLVEWRKKRVMKGIVSSANGYVRDSFILNAETPRFGSGEAKGHIESVRGDDLYLLVDVMNYSITYRLAGYENVMSPDDHYADLKRVIGAAGKKAHRINVIMPYRRLFGCGSACSGCPRISGAYRLRQRLERGDRDSYASGRRGRRRSGYRQPAPGKVHGGRPGGTVPSGTAAGRGSCVVSRLRL